MQVADARETVEPGGRNAGGAIGHGDHSHAPPNHVEHMVDACTLQLRPLTYCTPCQRSSVVLRRPPA